MNFKARVKDAKFNEKLLSDHSSKEYEIAFTEMNKYYDKIGIINDYDKGGFYQLRFNDGNYWWWTDRQIEIIPSISSSNVKKLYSLIGKITNEEASKYSKRFSLDTRKIICFCEKQIIKEGLDFDPYSYQGIQKYLLYFFGIPNNFWLDKYVDNDPQSSLNFLVSNFERNYKLLVNE